MFLNIHFLHTSVLITFLFRSFWYSSYYCNASEAFPHGCILEWGPREIKGKAPKSEDILCDGQTGLILERMI